MSDLISTAGLVTAVGFIVIGVAKVIVATVDLLWNVWGPR